MAQTDFIETFESETQALAPVFPLSKRAQPVIYAHSVKTQQGPHTCVEMELFSITILFQYIIELFTITIYDFININKFHKTTSIKYQNMNQVPNQIIMSTQMIAGLNEQYQQIQMFMDTNLDHPQVLFHDQSIAYLHWFN
ncbi:Hypothetical_protein [Hexamita inflata]|uniref:Hypothetical_protein n=1 Tax=Hexamita inflata TaxID=28002 RepID=A0ABP1HYY4_9EUKA